MHMTQVEFVRTLIGEEIPAGGTEADTMFTDLKIEDFIELGYGESNAAAFWGWISKMANYANLVTINEGNASREMTELHRNAKRMVEQYQGYVPTQPKGRVRIGTIRRPRVFN